MLSLPPFLSPASVVAPHLSTRSNARFCVALPEPSLRPLDSLASSVAAEPGRAIAAAGVVAAASTPPSPSRLDGPMAAAADIASVCAAVHGGRRPEALSTTRLCVERERERASGKRDKDQGDEKKHLSEALCRVVFFLRGESEKRKKREETEPTTTRPCSLSLSLFCIERVFCLCPSPSPSLFLQLPLSLPQTHTRWCPPEDGGPSSRSLSWETLGKQRSKKEEDKKRRSTFARTHHRLPPLSNSPPKKPSASARPR